MVALQGICEGGEDVAAFLRSSLLPVLFSVELLFPLACGLPLTLQLEGGVAPWEDPLFAYPSNLAPPLKVPPRGPTQDRYRAFLRRR